MEQLFVSSARQQNHFVFHSSLSLSLSLTLSTSDDHLTAWRRANSYKWLEGGEKKQVTLRLEDIVWRAEGLLHPFCRRFQAPVNRTKRHTSRRHWALLSPVCVSENEAAAEEMFLKVRSSCVNTH